MIPILMYHQIAEVPDHLDPYHLAVPPKQFREQMEALKAAGYSTVMLDGLSAGQNGHQETKKPLIITFDDGFHDVLTTAWPILESVGFSAIVFLVANQVGGESNWEGQSGDAAAALLDWDDIRNLYDKGMQFGSHSLTHANLRKIDIETLQNEVVESKRVIEEQLNTTIDHFCYPFTSHNETVRQAIADAGYRMACGGDYGPQNAYNLWRIECTNRQGLSTFMRYVDGWYYRKARLRGWARALIPGKKA